ncbi:hypothetical protein FOZ61_001896 [Perkinsus olseni]|uniref:Uncharacterized protein n=1 Tax=Perkinsus olseni TaxID=32597 RepID=A0A7J6MVZ6_PEROL|nr:hypothetical protein FOZ61_001896 [Perkinsus olseni]KAF4675789.1 hypothetical protein FOL46_000117 [Perkinsus olseni]
MNLHESLIPLTSFVGLKHGIHIARPIYEEGISCPNLSLPWFEKHWVCRGDHDQWATKGWMHPTVIARDPKWLGSHRLPRIDPVKHPHSEFIFKNELEDRPASWVQFHKICPPPLEQHKWGHRVFFSATNYSYPHKTLMRHDYFDNGYDDYFVRDWMKPDEDILRRH